MNLGGQQASGAAGGARAQTAGLDEQHRAEPGLVAGRSGGDARDPPAHDEHVRARLRQFPAAAREFRALDGRELVAPDSGVNGHDPIVCDGGHLDHGQG